MRKIRKILLAATCLLCCLWGSHAAAATIYDSPYVTFSPDGQAWTTCAGDKSNQHYSYGTTAATGVTSTLGTLGAGQHYYQYVRTGRVPVSRWVVEWPDARCIHNNYTTGNSYHGVTFGKNTCYRDYNSGWIAYCADCNQTVARMFVYMTKQAAETIGYLEVGGEYAYYFCCPHCNNLEQGSNWWAHTCRQISWNQYQVRYDANTSASYSGYMAPSYHMYNNAGSYEGRKITPVSRLSANQYRRTGYEFLGWNTRADGSGTSYENGAEILNLTTYDFFQNGQAGSVTLYAQWRKAESTLVIDPAGGSYQGTKKVTAVTQNYGTEYKLNLDSLQAPFGYTLSFETNGGAPLASVKGRMHFAGWNQMSPFKGSMVGNVYYFTAPSGNSDTIRATYEPEGITLPEPQKEKCTFGGWYYDPELEQPAGEPGEEIVLSKDTTLYAKWIDLQLYAEDNYLAGGGKGAVDLHWEQPEHESKMYKLYQSLDKEQWLQILSPNEIGNGTRAGFFEVMSLSGVKAQDLEAPDSILSGKQGGAKEKEVAVQGFGVNENGQIKITWQEPKDHGTTYYHVAESYQKSTGVRLCRSNITENTLTTGVRGYYWLIDKKPGSRVNAENGAFAKQPELSVRLTVEPQYLHVAAVDGAGNVSETAHIPLNELEITWLIHTRKLQISSGENVYYAEEKDLYYVRADGETPFTLTNRSYMEEGALEYQPNYIIWETLAGEKRARSIIYVPDMKGVKDRDLVNAEILQFSTEGTGLLARGDDTVIYRKERGREIEALQNFLLKKELSGVRMNVLPIAGVAADRDIVYSDYREDQRNGITLVADGEAPEIRGMESLESLQVIDRDAGEVLVNISASDALSGIGDFYVQVVNKDNQLERTYRPENGGTITLSITQEELLFAGDFVITAHAADRVGNVKELSYDATEFALKVQLQRILEPHEPIFRRGESGILSITAIGYAERVEVEFPEELAKLNPELNRTFVYTDDPEYQKEEQLQFMIPLDAAENADYTITVRAYKGDSSLEEFPDFAVLEVRGSILDDIRTRLR